MIPWWTVKFSEEQAAAVSNAIRTRNISQGTLTTKLEREIAVRFNAEDCVCVSSGTSALIVSMIAAGVGPGREVIVPNRTWIATAHAAKILGADVLVANTLKDIPVMDVESALSLFSERTAAVVPVFMNGRNVPGYEKLVQEATKRGIAVIDDAAQAIGSRDAEGRQLGATGLYGCFSLSVAKLVGSGQGGFILTNDQDVSTKLRAIRTHGVESTKEPVNWAGLGGNFRYTDLAAALVFEQLDRLDERISNCIKLYRAYESGLAEIKYLRQLPVDLSRGEVPVYNEFLCDQREMLQKNLASAGIETRRFYPDIRRANYLGAAVLDALPTVFENKGIYFPSGPDLQTKDIQIVLDAIRKQKWLS